MTPNTQIHDRSFVFLATGTAIKGGGVKLVLWTQTVPQLIDKKNIKDI